MNIDSDIRDQAYQFFIEEAPELLQEIESGILTLREERDIAKVHSIMRAAHSLKGSSASVGLESIKTIAHRLETIFKAFYSDTIDIDAELETQLLQAYDCLRLPLMEQLQYGEFDDQQALATAEPILSQLEVQCSEAIAATADFIPSSEDLGMSMVQSIFEIDVAEGLERLAEVIANPSEPEIAGELRAQAEVFTGFAELLNLPGFGAIATATIQALDRHPERVFEIAQLALENFRAGRSDVLNQPNSRGGHPSESLLTLANGTTPEALPESDISPASEAAIAAAAEVDLEAATDLFDSLANLDPNQAFFELGLIDPEADTTDPALENADSETDLTAAAADPLAEDFQALAAIAELSSADPDGDTTILAENDSPASTPDIATANTAVPPLPSESEPESESVSPATAISELAAKPLAGRITQPATTSTPQLTTPNASPTEINSSKPAATSPAQPTRPQTRVTTENVVTGLTVRVEAERLNRMNNLLGELTINRNGVELQNNQLQSSIKDLLGRFGRFQVVVENLRILSDQMLIAPERQQGQSALTTRRTNEASANSEEEFDSLEMDSYTQLYTQAQTLLEEIVQLEEAVNDVELFSYQSEQMLGRHRKMLSQMQDELMWARMIPLGQVLSRFPRVLRDLSSTYSKAVNLQLNGTDILVDKAVLSKLYDPLVQLLRNSFDHGIESAEVRQQRGKPEAGQIEIQARHQGRQVVIEVRDDGQGLDFKRISDRVVELGWLSAEAAQTCPESRLSRFIFEPGFSTARQVSELSGRGVGLDIVRDQIQSLNGSITVHSIPEQGSKFILTLPLTLTIVNLLICFVGATPLAIRSDSIQTILIPTPEQIKTVGSRQYLSWQEEDIAIYNLASLLKYHCLVPEMPPSRVLATVPTPTNWKAPILILKRGEQTFAIQIDRLVTEQELVVKPFGTAIKPPIYAYGCTVLGDGSLVPVIDGPVFLDEMVSRGQEMVPHVSEMDALAVLVEQNTVNTDGTGTDNLRRLQATTILVVDDAVTLRRTLALSLERAGYRVLQARDGQEALEQLEQSQSVEMVICDVEMPNMNGFEFLTKRREIPQFAHIPIMMLTSRGNDKHRWLAMKLGAVDYLTKPYLEQELLGKIAAHFAEAETAAVSGNSKNSGKP